MCSANGILLTETNLPKQGPDEPYLPRRSKTLKRAHEMQVQQGCWKALQGCDTEELSFTLVNERRSPELVRFGLAGEVFSTTLQG